jgi:hypothetical protein
MAVLAIVFATGVPCYGNGSIYGCVRQNNGQLRIIDPPNECRSSEDLIS